MRILSFTDAHISPKGEFSAPTQGGFTDYLDRIYSSFEWVFDTISRTEPDLVVFQGDLFETTGYVDTISLTIASDLIKQLSFYCDPYFIVGNHDAYNDTVNNLQFLKLGSNVTVVDKPRSLSYPDLEVLLLPWSKSPKLPFESDIILSHIDIRGSLLNSKARLEHGIDPTTLKPLVLNGHIHHPYRITDNVANIGALISRNFRDAISNVRGDLLSDLARGLVIVDQINDRSIKPGSHWFSTGKFNVYRCANPFEIQFRVIEILDPGQATRWQLNLDAGDVPECFVRVKCKERYRDLADNLVLLARGSQIQVIPENIPEIDDDEFSESFSPEDNFRNYVDEVLIFDEDGDRQRALDTGLAYIDSVKREFRHTLPIKFLSAEIINFQSLGDIVLDLSRYGLTYVEGRNCDEPAESNGSGKSSIPEAIYWCITGKSLRGYTGDDIIRWGTSSCCVKVTLRIGGREYIISRYRQDPTYKNDSRLSVRTIGEGPDQAGVWEDISCRRKTDTDSKIAMIVGRSREVLQHSIFLTADLQTRFTSLSYPDRVRLIEQITDSQIYNDILKRVVSDLDHAYTKRSELNGSRNAVEQSIQRISNRLLEINGALVEATRKRQDHTTDLKQQLRELLEKRDGFKQLISDASEEIASRQAPIDQKDAEIQSLFEAIQVESAATARCEANLSSVKDTLRSSLRCIADGKCSTCGQPVNDDAPISVKTNELKCKIPSLVDAVRTSKKRLSSALTDKDSAIVVRNRMRNEIRLYMDEVSRLEDQLLDLDRKTLEIKSVLRGIGAEYRSLIDRRSEAKDQYALMQKELSEIESRIADHDRVSETLEWLASAFSTKGLRARVLSSVTIPFLNDKLSIYSDTLGMPCFLSTTRERKSGDVEDQIEVVLTGQRSYKGCSRGERRKIDLAIQCALNDLAVATGGSQVNMLICDEVIDPLDDSGVSSFVDVLIRKSECMCILLMAHRPHLRELIGSFLVLEKRSGVTRLL